MSLLAFVNETLRDHLTGVVEVAVGFRKRALTLACLAGVELADALRAFSYSAVFHDVGKAYDWFQARIREEKGVFMHEYFSTFVASKVLSEKAFASQPAGDLYLSVLLAIALHHYPMRGAVLRENVEKDMKKLVDAWSVKLAEGERSELCEAINSALRRAGAVSGVDMLLRVEEAAIPSEITQREVCEFVGWLSDEVVRDSSRKTRLYACTMAVLSVLQLADIIAAGRSRGGRDDWSRLFVSDIPSTEIISKVKKLLFSC